LFENLLIKTYGFVDEELHFLDNYDIKYRIGKELSDRE